MVFDATVSSEAILALAMHLAMRMGNSRSMLLHSGVSHVQERIFPIPSGTKRRFYKVDLLEP